MGKGLAITTVAAAGVASTAAVMMRLFASAPKVASKDAIRVGLVGTGWALNVQLPVFKSIGLRITGIYSRDQTRADSIAAEKGIDKGYSDIKEMIASEEVDLVSVVSPVYLHVPQAIAVLEGGKHLLCDKPMAMSGEEAEKLLAVAKAHPDQVAIVDHELRFTPMLQEARRHVAGGSIGGVTYCTVHVCMARGADKAWSWWSDKAQGGGVLGAVGSHMIDTLRFVLGAEFSGVAGNLDVINTSLEGKPVTADDYVSFQMKLQAPTQQRVIRANMVLAAAGMANDNTIRIVGEKGCIILDINNSSMTVQAGGKEVGSVKGSGSGFASTGTRLIGQALQKALGPEQDKSALAVAAGIADGVAVMYVMDAMRASSDAGGKWVTPKTIAA